MIENEFHGSQNRPIEAGGIHFHYVEKKGVYHCYTSDLPITSIYGFPVHIDLFFWERYHNTIWEARMYVIASFPHEKTQKWYGPLSHSPEKSEASDAVNWVLRDFKGKQEQIKHMIKIIEHFVGDGEEG